MSYYFKKIIINNKEIKKINNYLPRAVTVDGITYINHSLRPQFQPPNINVSNTTVTITHAIATQVVIYLDNTYLGKRTLSKSKTVFDIKTAYSTAWNNASYGSHNIKAYAEESFDYRQSDYGTAQITKVQPKPKLTSPTLQYFGTLDNPYVKITNNDSRATQFIVYLSNNYLDTIQIPSNNIYNLRLVDYNEWQTSSIGNHTISVKSSDNNISYTDSDYTNIVVEKPKPQLPTANGNVSNTMVTITNISTQAIDVAIYYTSINGGRVFCGSIPTSGRVSLSFDFAIKYPNIYSSFNGVYNIGCIVRGDTDLYRDSDYRTLGSITHYKDKLLGYWTFNDYPQTIDWEPDLYDPVTETIEDIYIDMEFKDEANRYYQQLEYNYYAETEQGEGAVLRYYSADFGMVEVWNEYTGWANNSYTGITIIDTSQISREEMGSSKSDYERVYAWISGNCTQN